MKTQEEVYEDVLGNHALFTVKETAQMLGISDRTVRRYIKDGILECCCHSRHNMITRYSLYRFLCTPDESRKKAKQPKQTTTTLNIKPCAEMAHNGTLWRNGETFYLTFNSLIGDNVHMSPCQPVA